MQTFCITAVAVTVVTVSGDKWDRECQQQGSNSEGWQIVNICCSSVTSQYLNQVSNLSTFSSQYCSLCRIFSPDPSSVCRLPSCRVSGLTLLLSTRLMNRTKDWKLIPAQEFSIVIVQFTYQLIIWSQGEQSPASVSGIVDIFTWLSLISCDSIPPFPLPRSAPYCTVLGT